MFRKLVNYYFDYLEKKGRKYVIVSFTGKVYGFRYFPFFEETSDGIFPYPNLMINQSIIDTVETRYAGNREDLIINKDEWLEYKPILLEKLDKYMII